MDTLPSHPQGPWQISKDNFRPPSSHGKLLFVVELLIPAAVLLLIALGMVTGYLQNWLWMGQLKHTGIFWTLILVQWTMFAAAFAFVFLFMWINFRQALRNSGMIRGDARSTEAVMFASTNAGDQINVELTPRLLRSALVIVSLPLAWFAASVFFSQWDSYLRLRYGGHCHGNRIWWPIGPQARLAA